MSELFHVLDPNLERLYLGVDNSGELSHQNSGDVLCFILFLLYNYRRLHVIYLSVIYICIETNSSEIWIRIWRFSFTKMHLKMSSTKWRPFFLGHNVLNGLDNAFSPLKQRRVLLDCLVNASEPCVITQMCYVTFTHYWQGIYELMVCI